MKSDRPSARAPARHSVALRYGVAVGAISIATLLKIEFTDWIGRDVPTAAYLAAVMLAAWFGGTGPGLLATALAGAAGVYFFSDYSPFDMDAKRDAVRLALGVGEGVIISLAAGALRREVDARARAEQGLQRTTEHLFHAQKMGAIGTFAGGVAHDFNNMVAVVIGAADVLLRKLPPDDPKREDVEMILESGRRASNLAKQLLTFAHRTPIQPRLVDINDVLAGLDAILRKVVGSNISIVSTRDASLGNVDCDPGHIEQIVMNLVVNARDAMPDGGKLAIETANVDVDEAFARENSPLKAGAHVVITVSDSGTGMDDATKARIFEPFFTTKPAARGTGLGLYVVTGIAGQSGGTIRVESELGRGTTFRVYLPHAA